jgi:hypothetical protein
MEHGFAKLSNGPDSFAAILHALAVPAPHFMAWVTAEFESLGIAFVSLSDNLDLSTASGRLMFNIIGAMAEFERELIRERSKPGCGMPRRRERASAGRVWPWTLRG